MKNLIALLLITIFTTSCGKSNAEKLLYDHIEESTKTMNFTPESLELKIEYSKEIGEVTAKDSLVYVKENLAEIWSPSTKNLISDTLTFKFVKSKLNKAIELQDTLYKLHQKSLLTAIEYDNYSYEVTSKRKRDEALKNKSDLIEILIDVEFLERRFKRLGKDPDSILSTKYEVKYTIKNPLLNNNTQTFNKIFYSNKSKTKFVFEEDV